MKKVANDNQRPINRKNIRKDKNEMDLLNANEQRESEMAGFPEHDEWMDRRSTNNLNNYNRASTSYNKLTSSGRRDPLETTHADDQAEKAIDEFMKSPRNSNRRSTGSPGTLNQSPGPLGSAKSVPISGQPSYRKTGVNISKCYQMLCGRCGKRFSKVMIIEMTQDNEQHTVFDVQSFFNSTQNHDYECPFCYQKAQIIMSESLLVGDNHQLDYTRTYDRAQDKKGTPASYNQPLGSAQAFNQLGMTPSEKQGTKQGQEESDDPTYYEDCMEGRPH